MSVSRSQRTKVNGVMYEEERTEYGVPQGSILGPFIVLINELPEHLLGCRTHIYADGTAISVNGKSTVEPETQLNAKLKPANDWMIKKHLTLNCAKTKVMYFGTPHTLGILDSTTTGNVAKHNY